MLDTPCFELVWRVLATHSIRQFPLHFPSRASPYAVTFQQESTIFRMKALPPYSRSMRGKCDCFTFPVHWSHWPVQGSGYFHPRQSFLQSGSPTCSPYALPSCRWEQEFFPNPYFGSHWNESHWSVDMLLIEFYIRGSVHRETNLTIVQKMRLYSVYYISLGSSTRYNYY